MKWNIPTSLEWVPTDNPSRLLNVIEELLSTPDLKSVWREKVKQVYKDKIDVAKFYADVIENEIK